MSEFDRPIKLGVLLLILRRQILVFLLLAFIGLLLAWAVMKFWPRQYEATAKIIVERSLGVGDMGKMIALQSLDDARIDSEVEIFRADPVYLEVIRQLDLSNNREIITSRASFWPAEKMERLTENERYLHALAQLKASTVVRRVGGTQIINVTVRNRDKKQAAFLANNLAMEFVKLRQANQITISLGQRDQLNKLTEQARRQFNLANLSLMRHLSSIDKPERANEAQRSRLEVERRAAKLQYETLLSQKKAAEVATLFPQVSLRVVANATQPLVPSYPDVKLIAAGLFFLCLMLAGCVAVRNERRG